jgi:hypothetical protein
VNGFTIKLPEGFVALPASAATAEIGRALKELFHLPPGDISAAKVAESLSALGLIAAAGGAEYTAIGFFRSPDNPQRPVSVLLTAARMRSDHDDPTIMIAGLREVYAQDPDTDAQALQLRAGSAVAVIGVVSNSWQDWPHVCDLALDVFESVSWESWENSAQDQTVAHSL